MSTPRELIEQEMAHIPSCLRGDPGSTEMDYAESVIAKLQQEAEDETARANHHEERATEALRDLAAAQEDKRIAFATVEAQRDRIAGCEAALTAAQEEVAALRAEVAKVTLERDEFCTRAKANPCSHFHVTAWVTRERKRAEAAEARVTELVKENHCLWRRLSDAMDSVFIAVESCGEAEARAAELERGLRHTQALATREHHRAEAAEARAAELETENRELLTRIENVRISWVCCMGEGAELRLEVEHLTGLLGQMKIRAVDLEEVCRDSNAVCSCGCPMEDHEQYDEGISCEHDDHECVPTSRAVLAMLTKERARAADLERKNVGSSEVDVKHVKLVINNLWSDKERLTQEIAAALDHLDDYGRTHPDLPSACFAAVESANHWHIEAKGLRRDCEEIAQGLDAAESLLIDHHDVSTMSKMEWGRFCPVCVHDKTEDPRLALIDKSRIVARKYAEKGGAG